MRKIVGLALFFLCPQVLQASLHVVVDPGHGGADNGAVHSGLKEAEVVLKVSQLLADQLKSDPRFKVTLTRSSDEFLTLEERTKIALQARGDVFLSIHANASQDQRARGVEFYFQNHLPPDQEAQFLAATENRSEKQKSTSDTRPAHQPPEVSAILEDLSRQRRIQVSQKLSEKLFSSWKDTQSGAIRQAPFFVVSQSQLPSVLVELGFITNPKEAEKLKKASSQKEIADRLYAGLVEFYESSQSSPEREPLTSP
ncbi:MAG: N-acetylmuramoyl-L-alanine amidase [Proteobacteria bacterium]|jgi:N-acetylmuramoyl-L-alanine amidase|nr:N-acetylmuramoyl-L-alanine amidase [Pseudomonadota bacterium]